LEKHLGLGWEMAFWVVTSIMKEAHLRISATGWVFWLRSGYYCLAETPEPQTVSNTYCPLAGVIKKSHSNLRHQRS